MPKNPTTRILKRWQELDWELGRDFKGVNVREFARKWKVSPKTIHRDLEAFRGLGQVIRCQRSLEGPFYVWLYRGGSWLFLRNYLRKPKRSFGGYRFDD